MKHIFVLLMLAMMSNLALSQNGYPKKVIVGKDTLAAFTFEQVKQINVVKFNLDECKQIQDSLFKKIELDSTLISTQIALNKSLKSEIGIQKDIISNHTLINLELNKTLDKAIKDNKRQRIKVGVLGGTTLVLSVTTLVLLLTR
ncbi:MAG TPA: hypothetical protein PKI46_08495 [Bacteroidales bacterium]|nr:hypothetical protein [Bacteroidales bacterium]